MKSVFSFTCPSCGTPQNFSIFGSLKKVVKKKCVKCDAHIESEIRGLKYALLLIYIHVIATLVALPLVLGIVNEKWGMFIISVVISVILVFPPAMMLHARNAIVPKPEKYREAQ